MMQSHRARTSRPTNKTQTKQTPSPFIAHVHELRGRIFWVAAVFLVGSSLAYQYRDILVNVVLAPLNHQKLVYLTVGGGFTFIFQITMYAGILLAAPVLIFHLYRFVAPALPLRARKHTIAVFMTAVTLMVSGVMFGYFVAIPAAIKFLTTFAGGYVDPNLTADSYLNFVLGYLVGLGILFQLPLLLVFWHWISPLSGKQLLKSERFIIVFAFIAAAIITPTPDAFNQAMIAAPIIVIYQLGVLVIMAMNRADRRRGIVRTGPAAHSPLTLAALPTHRQLDLLLRLVEVVPPRAVPTKYYQGRAYHEGWQHSVVSREPAVVAPQAFQTVPAHRSPAVSSKSAGGVAKSMISEFRSVPAVSMLHSHSAPSLGYVDRPVVSSRPVAPRPLERQFRPVAPMIPPRLSVDGFTSQQQSSL